MVLILDGNSVHGAHAWRKKLYSEKKKKIRFVPALDVLKFLKQIKLQRSLPMCEPVSDLPSYISSEVKWLQSREMQHPWMLDNGFLDDIDDKWTIIIVWFGDWWKNKWRNAPPPLPFDLYNLPSSTITGISVKIREKKSSCAYLFSAQSIEK